MGELARRYIDSTVIIAVGTASMCWYGYSLRMNYFSFFNLKEEMIPLDATKSLIWSGKLGLLEFPLHVFIAASLVYLVLAFLRCVNEWRKLRYQWLRRLSTWILHLPVWIGYLIVFLAWSFYMNFAVTEGNKKIKAMARNNARTLPFVEIDRISEISSEEKYRLVGFFSEYCVVLLDRPWPNGLPKTMMIPHSDIRTIVVTPVSLDR